MLELKLPNLGQTNPAILAIKDVENCPHDPTPLLIAVESIAGLFPGCFSAPEEWFRRRENCFLRICEHSRRVASLVCSLVCRAAGFCRWFCRMDFRSGLGRIRAARDAPGVGGRLVGNALQRIVVGFFGRPIRLDLLSCFGRRRRWSGHFIAAVELSVSRSDQQQNHHCRIHNSHVYVPPVSPAGSKHHTIADAMSGLARPRPTRSSRDDSCRRLA
jgi:hypothetical protein